MATNSNVPFESLKVMAATKKQINIMKTTSSRNPWKPCNQQVKGKPSTTYTWTGGLICVFSALLDSIATLLRLEELNRLFLEPPPIVLILLLPKLWLLLRLTFMFILAAPTPGFLKMKKKSLLLKKPLTHKVLIKKMYLPKQSWTW